MDHKPDTYALSEAEHDKIFRTRVVPRYFRDEHEASPTPTAVILGGQPGAGKTALLRPAEVDMNEIGSTVVINGDDLRSFHPQYLRLQKTDPENAAQLTNHDSGRWVEKLIAEGIERRVNLVIESTMRNPDVFSATSERLREAGYSVEARAIAVNERVSWQGVHTRYEGMIASGALPRFTVREAHDAGVNGMLVTLRRIEDDQLADRMLIGTRGGEVIYDNRLEKGIWQLPPGAAKAVEDERNRPRTPGELEAFSADWQLVLARMDSRKADRTEFSRVQATALADVAHFRSQMGDGHKQVVADSDLPELLIPAAHLPDLTPAQVSERAQASELVQRRKAEAEQLSLVVFGSSAAISDALSRIDNNPALASGIASDLKSEPGQFGALAGEPGGWIRRASPERQNAEANLPGLATAIDDYGSAVRYQQSRILQEHSAEQRRVSQEVPMPSADLAKVLRSMPEVQLQQFSERPDLRKELTQLSVAFDKRLAPHEHKAFHVGDLASAQRSLGVSSVQIRQIAQAKQQFKESNQIVRSQSLAMNRGPMITR